VKISILIFSTICLLLSSGRSKAETNSPAGLTNAIILPELIPDPLEKLNRRFWIVNEAAMKAVMKPSEKVYRLLVPAPFRIGISNVGQNLQYPRRLVNNILQERWAGAGHESARFLCNSVLGMGGFLNVAGDLHIPVSDRDFGETFGTWGWKHNLFLMIPVAGPNSDRDGVGAFADSAVNPLSYYSPYSYIPACIRYNDLADEINRYIRLSDSEMDPYSLVRYGFALDRPQPPSKKEFKPEPTGDMDFPSLESLQAARFDFRDPHFPERGRTKRVKLPGQSTELHYTMWLQKKTAPIIYILPGIGSHLLNGGSIALAELFYER